MPEQKHVRAERDVIEMLWKHTKETLDLDILLRDGKRGTESNPEWLYRRAARTDHPTNKSMFLTYGIAIKIIREDTLKGFGVEDD